jgi:crossover junction endodeoxyribonuclease RusA
MITIELPLPDSRLSPNRKNGKAWQSTKALKDTAFNAGYYAAKQASHGKGLLGMVNYSLSIIFYEPTRRSMDLDNRFASCKPVIDGISKALGIDDKQFNKVMLSREYRKGSGGVVLMINEGNL